MIELGLIGGAGIIATMLALPFLHGGQVALYAFVSISLFHFGFGCGPTPDVEEDDPK